MVIEYNELYGQKTDVENKFSELNNEVIKVIVGAEPDSEEVIFITESGKVIKLYHEQDCCESVSIVDVDGEPSDLAGALVLSAEEVVGESKASDGEPEAYYGWDEYHTWTFYKVETSKGGITIRWVGSSNGYYSETVDVVGGRVKGL